MTIRNPLVKTSQGKVQARMEFRITTFESVALTSSGLTLFYTLVYPFPNFEIQFDD